MNTDIDFIRRYTKKPKNNRNLILLTMLSHFIDTTCEDFIKLRDMTFKNEAHLKEVYYKLYREMAEAAIEKFIKDENMKDCNDKEQATVWDFVTKYYPDYYHAQRIADADDLEKLIHNEVNGDAETQLHEDYDGDIKNPQIQIDYDEIHSTIYAMSIERFLSGEKN